ncbi:hypothetical protein ED236_00330 [Pseudomethylobacillus aquaticus]|uniref:Uncharacterized protein n=1 Tax=Pseudomethylobacillus aquaticus TaxID=2676064 RepID=A0A3N0V5L9_9PROT|nr:hypothetical protein [Pseudomethylobacillus aquaticus]ROH87975.1 hypothetical protein ED236_00330 [Pseudomethylobacillus aquaticus]
MLKYAAYAIGFMLLFPPYHALNHAGVTLKAGYGFILALPHYEESMTQYGQTHYVTIPGTIDHATLILQILVVAVIAYFLHVSKK